MLAGAEDVRENFMKFDCNWFECGADCEQLITGFGQLIHKRIIINLSFACIILYIIAYYIISSFINL